jgi:pyrroline-5-carboxylate reductase
LVGVGKIGSAILMRLEEERAACDFELSAFSRSGFSIPEVAKSDSLSDLLSSDLVFLCVKPRDLLGVAREIKESKQFANRAKAVIFVSVAAGVELSSLQKVLPNSKLVRAMPSLCSRFGKGVFAFSCNELVSKQDKRVLNWVFSKLGEELVEARERDLDALTIVSGCTPALFSFFALELARAGEKLGLEKSLALLVAKKSLEGTGHVLESKGGLEEIISEVATPGGVTNAIISELGSNNFSGEFSKGVNSGMKRLLEIKASANSLPIGTRALFSSSSREH